VLTTLLCLLCTVYTLTSLPAPGRGPAFTGLVLLTEVGMLGTFVALDLVLFFVFFEVVLIPMYFLIAVWGGPGPADTGLARPGPRPPPGRDQVGAVPAARVGRGAGGGGPRVRQRRHVRHRGAVPPRRGRHRARHAAGRVPGVVPRLRGQVAAVPAAHLAAGRAHRGTHRRLGAAGRGAAEDGHLRAGAGRAAGGAVRGALARPGAGRARGGRDRGRRAVLPGADRRQAADRLLLGGPHGLRAARHRHPDADRDQRRAAGQHRPRHHHRAAVLPDRRRQGPVPHRRPAAARVRADGPAAGARRAVPAGLRGQPRAARAGRLLGRGVRPAGRVPAGPGAARRAVRGAAGGGRRRHRAHRGVLPAAAARAGHRPGRAVARPRRGR